jgi:hypothetical protein
MQTSQESIYPVRIRAFDFRNFHSRLRIFIDPHIIACKENCLERLKDNATSHEPWIFGTVPL